MPIPIDARRKPANVKVHVSSGNGVDITWADGHASHFDFAYLREECPCAMCNDERMKKAQGQEKDRQLKRENAARAAAAPLGSPLLPMYKPKLAAKSAHAVGNYALQIDFNDGHATGIYSFDYLRTICPCQECAREYRAQPDL
jgi:prepilin-type processing-associated H-X9-DG protein